MGQGANARQCLSLGPSATALTGAAIHALEQEGGAEITPALSSKHRLVGQSREPQCCSVLPPFFQHGLDEGASSISVSL